jgi:hypothetical protein
MRLRVKLHAPAALSSGMNPGTHSWGVAWAAGPFWATWREEKGPLRLPGFEPPREAVIPNIRYSLAVYV